MARFVEFAAVLAISVFVWPGQLFAVRGGLSLHVEPKTQQFSADSPIKLRFVLQNDGSDNVFVDRLLLLGDTVQVKETSGKSINFCGKLHSRSYSAGDYTVLRPGESVIVEREISCKQQGHLGVALRPGRHKLEFTYTLNARYVQPFAKGARIPHKPVRSNIVSFEIVTANHR